MWRAAILMANGANAATDVTGFGLLGHLREVCVASDVGATVDVGAVPVLSWCPQPSVEGMWAGGSQRNLDSVEPDVTTDLDVSAWKHLADAQNRVACWSPSPRIGSTTYTGRCQGLRRSASSTLKPASGWCDPDAHLQTCRTEA